MDLKSKLCFGFYSLGFLAYAIYSYAFLDIGLTLTSFKPYLLLQKKMQWFGYFNRPNSTLIFIIICFFVFSLYYLLFSAVKKIKISLREIIFLAMLICGILVFSYPAFSHDIFNYIFNAKMIVEYNANPHVRVAADFPDPMLGFMRNIHTPAPYFYGWTLISLLPYFLSFGRIFPSLVNFKLFSILFYFLTLFILEKIFRQGKYKDRVSRLVLFLLNPLVLIEAIGVGHNDLSMTMPALLSFYFLVEYRKKNKLKFLLFAFLSLLFSLSIKYATVILVPLFIIWYLRPQSNIGFWGAVLLFFLPFIRPLDQFHSWYFIWPLTWVFLSKKIDHIYFFCFISFFSLLRYAPYIYHGNWDPPVSQQRLVIYFLTPLIILLFNFSRLIRSLNASSKKNSVDRLS